MADGWNQTAKPCPHCGSSDAASENTEGWWHCFSCGKNWKGDGQPSPHKERVRMDLLDVDIAPIKTRGLTLDTCKFYGYGVAKRGNEWVQVAPYGTPTGITGQKIRTADKNFSVVGKLTGFFGQRHFKTGGKMLTVTEGEIDAMSYAQVTGCQWPVVSLPNGAQGAKKAFKDNLEWVESFDKVILWFDTDEPGRKAAAEIAELLTPGKACIASASHGCKDANDMLMKGLHTEMKSVVWNATPTRPDGIINADSLWEEIDRPLKAGQPYPWKGLNQKLYGLRPREIVTFCAGSGVGKSAIVAEIAYHLAQIGDNIGYIALEEGCDRTALRFVGLHLDCPIHLPGNEVSTDSKRAAFDATLGTGRYWLYDSFGSVDSDNLLAKMRYLVKGCGVKWLVLDHLSIVVSGLDQDTDERRAIDRTMTRLRTFTEETGVGLLVVSHLKRPDGKGHEEGGLTSLAQLRGSAAIAQLSDAVIGLERNQQDDKGNENVTKLRILKNRYSGVTGEAGALEYDHTTGRLKELDGFDSGSTVASDSGEYGF